jgi:hypothetical protein
MEEEPHNWALNVDGRKLTEQNCKYLKSVMMRAGLITIGIKFSGGHLCGW